MEISQVAGGEVTALQRMFLSVLAEQPVQKDFPDFFVGCAFEQRHGLWNQDRFFREQITHGIAISARGHRVHLRLRDPDGNFAALY